MEHRIVDGGGALADAAANAVLRPAAHVDGGGEIAIFRREAAGGLIIGEFLSGQDNGVVAPGGGQLHIRPPGGGAGDGSGGLPQHIPEQAAPQVLLGHLGLGQGQGDGEGLAPLGRLVGAAQGLDVKIDPHRVVGNLHGLQVQGGVLGLGVHRPVDGLKVGLGHLAGLAGQLHLLHGGLSLAAEALLIARQQVLLRLGPGLLPVHSDHRRPLDHHQPVLLNGVALVVGGGDRLLHPLHQVLEGGVVLRDHRRYLTGHAQHMSQQLGAAGEEVPPALLPGVLGALGSVHLNIRPVQLLAELLVCHIVQRQGHILPLLAHRRLHRTLGLLHRHVGYIYAGNGHVGQNFLPSSGPGAQPQIGRRQYAHHRTGDEPGQLAAALLFRYALSLHRSHSLLLLPYRPRDQ